MPFESARQMRAAFAGKIPGFDKEKALEWARETPDIKSLPERAPAEKGKPTLRSKVKKHKEKIAAHLDLTRFCAALKLAALGQVNSRPSNVGRFSGIQTPNALKAPGAAASLQAINPRRGLSVAMNLFKSGL